MPLKTLPKYEQGKITDGLIIRVALYIRVSSDEQAKHGYSLSSQKERLEEFSKEKFYKIVDYYIDEGKTARTKLSKRKELLRLLEDVKLGLIDHIVFWRLDRYFRNVADYYKVQEILDEHGVTWECSDEEYDTTTSNGRLYLNIKLSIAQNESDQTSDRIIFNQEKIIKKKRAIFGNNSLPPGYIVKGKKGDKRVVKDKGIQHIVDEFFIHFNEYQSARKTMTYINDKY